MEVPRIEYLIWEQAHWPPPPRWRAALGLALVTLLTTTVVGARLAFNFAQGRPAYMENADLFPFAWAWRHPGLIAAGLPFSLALMGILLAHEFGHYAACRRYRLNATLPWFLPAPTLIGTLGAFIRIRSPFVSRRQVFDVGIAGPLAGLVVAVPVLIAGLVQSRIVAPQPTPALEFGWPPLMHWLAGWLAPGATADTLLLSPLARAGWVGLFVTMLNLLPAAQLDGGHILFACAPRVHRPVSWCLVGLLALAGWRYWPGWYFWAGFIAVMRARHPQVDDEGPLNGGRLALALLAAAIFAATFLPAPLL